LINALGTQNADKNYEKREHNPACRWLHNSLISACKVQYAPTESRLQGKSNFRFVPEADVDKTALNQLVIMTSTPLIG